MAAAFAGMPERFGWPTTPAGWASGILVLAMLLLLLGWWLRPAPRKPGFRVRRRALLTENEVDFLTRLENAFPEYDIHCQVSMGALMEPDVPGGSPDFLSIRARFAQKVVDFVLVDGAREVVALIELDDRSHRQEKDAERDAMTAKAGYITLRYASHAKPGPAELRSELQRLHAALRRAGRP